MQKPNLLALLIVMFGAFGVGLGLAGCDSSLDSIKHKRVIHIGVSRDLPPFSYRDSSGELVGFEILLGRKLAKDLLGDESRVEFIEIPSPAESNAKSAESHPAQSAQDPSTKAPESTPNTAIAAPQALGTAPQSPGTALLDSGQVDLLLASAHIPPPSARSSTPYMHARLSVIGTSGTPSGIQALFSSSLLVRQGSYAQAYFHENYPHIQLLACQDLTQCLSMLKERKAAYFADFDSIAQLIVQQGQWRSQSAQDQSHANENLALSIQALGEPYPIAATINTKDTALLSWLDKELMTLEREDFLEQSFKQAFTQALSQSFAQSPAQAFDQLSQNTR